MLINNNVQLKQFFLKSQKDKIIGMDTEFFRVSTYYPKLCLIQLSNKTNTIIIDPLSGTIDLELVRKIILKKDIIKVLHAAYQDIEILFNLFGKIPINLIDTQLCLPEIGYPISTGYAEACKDLLNIQIDKKNQFIDWRKRPLDKEKICYAIKDVKYLPKLFLKINEKVDIKKNKNILTSHNKLLDEEIYKKKPEKAWERLKISEIKKYKIEKLKIVCCLREKLAQKLNLPSKKILADKKIKALCKKEIDLKKKKIIICSIEFDSLKKELINLF